LDKDGNLIPDEEYLENEYIKNILANPLAKKFDNIYKNFDYRNAEELSNIITGYGKHFKFAQLFDVMKCSELNPLTTGKKVRMLYLPLISRYADMITLEARVDFSKGNYEAGLTRLYQLILFSMDLYSGSTRLGEAHMALRCFSKTCQEIIPLLLSRDISFNSLAPYEAECLAAFGNFKPGLFPIYYDSPPEEGPVQLPMLQSFENLINTALNKFKPSVVFKKEYFSLVKSYDDIYDTINMEKTGYHLYGKLRFWQHWFSVNRYFYKEGMEFYRGLFEQMKYMGDMHLKKDFINDYFNKHVTNNNIITADIPRIAADLNAARVFGKLVLIIHAINQYGIDSKEFLNLKGSDAFINEISGDKFEISVEGEECSIMLGKSFKLDLKKIKYGEGHKKILKSFQSFEK
jgi:hypothetical protein